MTTRGTAAPPKTSAQLAKPQGSTWRGFANLITISRLGLIPVILFCLEAGFAGSHQIAAGLFVVGAATDSLDGMVARRRQEVSSLGIFLDPLADKLLVIAALFPLVSEGVLPAWAGFVIVAREVAVVILRTRGTRSGVSISANRVAKLKTLTQDAMVVVLILQRPYPELAPYAGWLVALAVIFTVWSGGVYLWRFRSLLGWR
ncbi:MAG TPA: CDP-diacylglycerol--glycerol-3-phosphate 3-phosphatidyltransferase [Candidatus Dormibacteraeota bacterium]|nr:CDP-diacylglycerol--glycerol-3-phosphate 3-phosphatidyltransferase [Candidatus Dormibacteraeota bacterium]